MSPLFAACDISFIRTFSYGTPRITFCAALHKSFHVTISHLYSQQVCVVSGRFRQSHSFISNFPVSATIAGTCLHPKSPKCVMAVHSHTALKAEVRRIPTRSCLQLKTNFCQPTCHRGKCHGRAHQINFVPVYMLSWRMPRMSSSNKYFHCSSWSNLASH